MVNSSYLKSIRKAKNINLSTLSADIGCTASYLSQIERGLKQPSLSVLRKLSEALNIPMVSLLAPENPEQSPSQDRSAQQSNPSRAQDKERGLYPDQR